MVQDEPSATWQAPNVRPKGQKYMHMHICRKNTTVLSAFLQLSISDKMYIFPDKFYDTVVSGVTGKGRMSGHCFLTLKSLPSMKFGLWVSASFLSLHAPAC